MKTAKKSAGPAESADGMTLCATSASAMEGLARSQNWNDGRMSVEHVLSLSYGKDSLACLGAIKELGWPLDRIVHAEVWATDTIPADLPPMVEFKKKADAIINERLGIEVQHVSTGQTYSNFFHRTRRKSRIGKNGEIYGWPGVKANWCTTELKIKAFKKLQIGEVCIYLGIAKDEPDRIEKHKSENNVKMPLVEAGWTEAMCREWCEKNGLLSPIYTTATRGGCWFCHNQSIDQLRLLRKNYHEYWELMLKWDCDSPKFTYFSGKHKIIDYERRFQMEELGIAKKGRKFRWPEIDQVNIFDCMR